MITDEIEADSIKDYYEGLIDDDAGYTYNDYLEEFGYNGELYVCYEEFCDSEYQDVDYMHNLLNNEKLIIEYDKDIKLRTTSVADSKSQSAIIITKHNICDMLNYPEKYIDEYSDTEILTVPDEEAEGGTLRFLIGVENGEYYIVVEDDYSSDDIYPNEQEPLIQTFVRALNDNLMRA